MFPGVMPYVKKLKKEKKPRNPIGTPGNSYNGRSRLGDPQATQTYNLNAVTVCRVYLQKKKSANPSLQRGKLIKGTYSNFTLYPCVDLNRSGLVLKFAPILLSKKTRLETRNL